MTAQTVKQQANECAAFASQVVTYGLATGIHDADPSQMRDDLTKMFAAWPALCRAMSRMEHLAPNAAQAGYAKDQRLQDHLEAA